MPWKNGLGITIELAVSPARGSSTLGGFDWRLSIASVTTPGPFSSFPGVDRVLVVLQGEGMCLDHGPAGGRVELRPLVPHTFSGDWSTVSELPWGPIKDFNVMTRRDRVSSRVTVLNLTVEDHLELSASSTLFYVIEGEVELIWGEDRAEAVEGELAWVESHNWGGARQLSVIPGRQGVVLLQVDLYDLVG